MKNDITFYIRVLTNSNGIVNVRADKFDLKFPSKDDLLNHLDIERNFMINAKKEYEPINMRLVEEKFNKLQNEIQKIVPAANKTEHYLISASGLDKRYTNLPLIKLTKL